MSVCCIAELGFEVACPVAQRVENLRRILGGHDPPNQRRHRPVELPEAARCQFDTEGGRHRVLEPVRLVEDDQVVLRQQTPVEGHARSVQMVVDDDDVRGRRTVERRHRETVRTLRAVVLAGTFHTGHRHL